MALIRVTTLDVLEEAKPSIHTIGGRSIGLIKVNDAVCAVRNVCPHKRAPICKGHVRGTMLPSEPGEFVFGLENQILQCPWHGWEFNLMTGEAICKENTKRLTLYPVTVENGVVYVDI